LFRKPERKDHFEDPDTEWWITLKLIFKKTGWQTSLTGLIWFRTGTCGSSGKHGETLGLIKCGEFDG